MTENSRSDHNRIGFFVILVRALRRMRLIWQDTRLEYKKEQETAKLLLDRQYVIDSYLTNQEIHKLQIGTGTNYLDGWLNTDLEPTGNGVVYLNALEKFPFDDQVFDNVFSEHMIEHITYKDGLFMLKECYRVMKSGGKIRIATPDVKKFIALYSPQKTELQKKYLSWSSEESIGLYSAEKSPLQAHRPEWAIDHKHIQQYFSDPSEDSVCFVVNNFFRSYGHKFLYDRLTLEAALKEAGFANISLFAPGESNDLHLSGIESHDNLIGEEMNRFETMVLEGIRL